MNLIRLSFIGAKLKEEAKYMSKLKDVVDDKTGKFIKQPPMVIQDIVPADDVAKSISEHMRYRYQMTSITPLNTGPHGGRLLLLYQYTGQPVAGLHR